jgi:hypothetical protein
MCIKLIQRPTPTVKLPHRVGVIFFLRVISPLPGTYFHFLCGFHAGRKGGKLEKFEIIFGLPRNNKVHYKSVHSWYHTLHILVLGPGFRL